MALAASRLRQIAPINFGVRVKPLPPTDHPGTRTTRRPAESVELASTGKFRVAGPSITLPFGSNVEPWHGHKNDWSFSTSILQCRCMQIDDSASSIAPRRMTKNPSSRKFE